jgi:ParB family chromosome partitioning protein
MQVEDISVDNIRISEFNTRKDLTAGMEDASLADLANSITERGLLNPITVMTRPDGKFDLIAGQRRFLACKIVGMKTIPAIVRDDVEDVDATIISLVENVHRADMSPVDKARAYQKIYEKYGDYGRVARETGLSVPTVRRYLLLLDLAPSIQQKLSTAEGPVGVAALSKLAETFAPHQQERALEELGGFKQSIQLDMMKRSGGNLEQLSALRDKALEGHFDVKMCREGLCFAMPEELKAKVRKMLAEGS